MLKLNSKMPQFDVSSFFNQIFWLSLFFCTFYLILVGFLLPHLVSSLKLRNKKEKSELSLSFQALISSKKTDLLIKLNQKLLSIKLKSGFYSVL